MESNSQVMEAVDRKHDDDDEFNMSTVMVIRHLLALLRVGSLQVLYSIRSCSLFYAVPLSKINRNNNLMSHCYADDMQIYITVKTRQGTLTRLLSALKGV